MQAAQWSRPGNVWSGRVDTFGVRPYSCRRYCTLRTLMSSTSAAFVVDPTEDRIAPRRQLSDAEWDDVIAVMKERRITALDAGGMMTDEVLARVAALDHVTALSLGGSRQLTDDGVVLMWVL